MTFLCNPAAGLNTETGFHVICKIYNYSNNEIYTSLASDMDHSNDTFVKTVYTYTHNRQYVLLEIGTGTWCRYCPGAAMEVDDFVENGQQVAVVENHNGDGNRVGDLYNLSVIVDRYGETPQVTVPLTFTLNPAWDGDLLTDYELVAWVQDLTTREVVVAEKVNPGKKYPHCRTVDIRWLQPFVGIQCERAGNIKTAKE